jgi:single-strand DNA-binding protein
MSRGLNKIMIIGHLGRDPEMRYTPAGKSVTSFSVAVNRSWESSDGTRRNQTEWFNVIAWGSLAEFCKQVLSKGKQVYVEGRLQTRRWDDPQGNQRISVEIIASELIPLGEKNLSNEAPAEPIQTIEDIEEDGEG